MRWLRRIGLAVVAVIAAGFAVAFAAGFLHGSSSSSAAVDDSSSIATQIGAFECTMTAFYLTNRLDDSKTRLYDCEFLNGPRKCVTEANGIISDDTASAKLLFASTLGTTKPECAA